MHKLLYDQIKCFDSKSLQKIEEKIQVPLSLSRVANLVSQSFAGFIHVSQGIFFSRSGNCQEIL